MSYSSKRNDLLSIVASLPPSTEFALANISGYEREPQMGKYLTTHADELQLEVLKKDVNGANRYRKKIAPMP